jgi:catechol 2,3-dioxygenase-like lactoylglutathione lyase family enzyme
MRTLTSFGGSEEGRMQGIQDAEAMAAALRSSLRRLGTDISDGAALEIVAAQLGHESWNILSAKLADTAEGGRFGFQRASPIMRIFDEARAREFYLGFLGFTLDWEHRFGDDFPLYAQVSRAGLVIHLSEHHGDGTPGSVAFVTMRGIRAFERELAGRDYPYFKPAVEEQPWGLTMSVTDPFSNGIRFCEPPTSQ